MERPGKEVKTRTKRLSASKYDTESDISLTRKILVGIFILGFWIFFYWFWKP